MPPGALGRERGNRESQYDGHFLGHDVRFLFLPGISPRARIIAQMKCSRPGEGEMFGFQNEGGITVLLNRFILALCPAISTG
jgi:hypothetical protein